MISHYSDLVNRKKDEAMKEYFSHDYNARNDPKLQEVLCEHGVAGLGVFWAIIENLYEQGGELPLNACKSIAFALHTESNIVGKCLSGTSICFRMMAKSFGQIL